MKLQVSFDITDLEQALKVAHLIQDHVDIFEIGTLLLYKYGIESIRRFRKEFPHKTLLADAKIMDRVKDAVTLFAQENVDWITVMAGAGSQKTHNACTNAHDAGKKIMLDLADATSLGQIALEAKSLGADALIFHKSSNESGRLPFLDQWEIVRGNTTLPIYLSAHVSRDTIDSLLTLNADGLVIGSAIVTASDPLAEVRYFVERMEGK